MFKNLFKGKKKMAKLKKNDAKAKDAIDVKKTIKVMDGGQLKDIPNPKYVPPIAEEVQEQKIVPEPIRELPQVEEPQEAPRYNPVPDAPLTPEEYARVYAEEQKRAVEQARKEQLAAIDTQVIFRLHCDGGLVKEYPIAPEFIDPMYTQVSEFMNQKLVGRMGADIVDFKKVILIEVLEVPINKEEVEGEK